MLQIEYSKLKEYCENFLSEFEKDENLKVQIKVDRPQQKNIIATISSNIDLHCNSELGIQFDENTINTFSSFTKDYYVDEFDNTWEKYSEDEIVKIIEKLKQNFKNIISNGCYLIAYVGSRKELETAIILQDKNNIDFKRIYNQNKLRSHPDFDKINQIKIFDYHYNIIEEYNVDIDV